jgi:hypothetical protein
MYVTCQISVIHILTIRFNIILHPKKPQHNDVAVGYQVLRSFLHYLDLKNV